jgi:23S rRNA (cytosine1962-C5)-methyltransferase
MPEGVIRIKRGREKPIGKRHPWVFSGAIAHAENAVDGELVTLVDHKNRFLARGYWNSQSQIQVRIMSWLDEPIDEGWWRKMLARAICSRAGLDAGGAAYRLVNAENDFIPGLIVDRYGDWLVLQALTCYIDAEKVRIVDLLRELTGIENVYERSDVDARKKEGLAPAVGLLRGKAPPGLVEIIEGACFQVDIERGHKTGFYLDQRENRRALANLVSDCRETADETLTLLNMFCYTGGFAVAAGHFGSVRSVNVDSSYAALELAEANFARNGYDVQTHGETAEFIQADAFDYLRHCIDEAMTFDFVLLDPPKFARHKGQTQRAARGYKDLNLNAFKLVREGGCLLTCSCSGAISRGFFQQIVFSALADAGREAQIVRRLSAAADHPVALTFPEGEYLKGLLLRVF